MDAPSPAPGFTLATSEEIENFVPDFELLSFTECRQRGAAIGRNEDDSMVLLCTHGRNLLEMQRLELIIIESRPNRLIRLELPEIAFQSILSSYEMGLRAMDDLVTEEAGKTQDGGANEILVLSLELIAATKIPTVKTVDSTLFDALRVGASDIHFEVNSKGMHIKYRIDGVLQSVRKSDGLELANQVISRIKILSNLDISERRTPQDGRFKVSLEGREIDFRVSIMPNIVGEDAVLRILDRKHLTGQFESLSLDTLSFDEPTKSFIRKSSRLPYGLLLVTGPTGSGKTTTLYAAISEINTGLDKIVTIEDPIEYQLHGVLQIPVNEKKGLTFAKGLRSILRHDPDKIMVGEIRDAETAQIAVQAALTGHQVFTTVHANNVFDVIGRFANMGVDSYSLVAALSGILAQRLVRTLCQKCAEHHTPSTEELASIASTTTTEDFSLLKKACGCQACNGTGYKGRTTIAETLLIDDEMKVLLIQQAPITTIKQAAKKKGFLSLRDSAVFIALRGVTTIEEINRVTPI